MDAFIKDKNKVHIFFLFLLSLNYLIPLIIFGKVTLFYHDTLDGEIVYNTIIGKFFGGDLNSVKIFLNGEIENSYLRRLFQPFSLFYFFFNPETAYWIIDVLVKLTSYFSFYILAKKISLKKFESGLVACLFACINLRSHDGFGIAITPYLIYLLAFKKSFKFKNYFIIFFSGLNTDFATCMPQIPAIIFASYILNKNNFQKFIRNNFLIIGTFTFFVFLSNINLVYAQITYGNFHRETFIRESYPFFENLLMVVKDTSFFPNNYDWTLVRIFPQFLLTISILFFLIFKRSKKNIRFIILILVVNLLPFFLRIDYVNDLRNASSGLFKTFHFEYIVWVTPLLFLIILNLLFKSYENYFRYLKFICLICIFLFQVSSSIVPFGKKYIFKEKNYRNIYTFEGYYMYKDYRKIRNIVNAGRVISIGYDPMIAAMNGINVSDGYHTIYPKSYKFKFRKIIENELRKDIEFSNYYDNWGSRVYAFVSDPNEINLNFQEAKKIGTKFIISKYMVNSGEIKLISEDFDNKIFLYKIK